MKVLIVQSRLQLGQIWQRHLERSGMDVTLVGEPDAALKLLGEYPEVHTLVLDLDLRGGAAINIADYASYRHPEIDVIFVTGSSFFSDGSIFSHFANARAFLPVATPPEDLALMIEHYCAAS